MRVDETHCINICRELMSGLRPMTFSNTRYEKVNSVGSTAALYKSHLLNFWRQRHGL